MRLVVTEKNDAAKQIANLLAHGKPKADKVFNTPVYRFDVDGDEWVTIGLRGHILQVDFTPQIIYKKRGGWMGVTADGEMIDADIPSALPKPPFKKKKPFSEDGVDLHGWKVESLPYLAYAPIVKLPKEKDIIRSLKNLAKKADSIVIATDFDREGELIGSDALMCCREVNLDAPVFRARYSSFTKPEITHSFANLVDMDMDLAAAGQTRQDIDLIWGAALTRYLSLARRSNFHSSRPAGRVQTPTLALIVAKEEERNAFVPEDFWVIKGAFDADAEAGPTEGEGEGAFSAVHSTARFKDEASAKAAMAAIDGAKSAKVAAVEKKQRKVAPPTPFNTTSFMAAASNEGVSPSRAMRIAESLYMDGYISYPRTDNTVYPDTMDLAEHVQMLSKNPAYNATCSELLRKGSLHATRGKKQTTDHPPIYPTACVGPNDLPAPNFKIYNLIARRFLATLSDVATIEGTKITLDVNGEGFVAKGDVIVDPGFRAIYPYGNKKDEVLPAVTQGQNVAFNGATCTKDQTKPPARYSQGRLIQEMEKEGLGTKATRANIIERLYEVKYIQNDPIEPTQLGIAVIDALGEFAPHITHSQMTAELEEGMDDICAGKTTHNDVVRASRELLERELGALIPKIEEVGEALKDAVNADSYIGKCPKCGHDLQVKHSFKTKGNFIGCANWPDCDVTYPLPEGKLEVLDTPCEVCGMPRLKVSPWRSKPYEICIDPACATNQEPEFVVGKCPNCAASGLDKNVIGRRNPRTRKRSATCENFDECQTRYPLPAQGEITTTDEVCEHCGAPLIITTSRRGPWKRCINFDCPGKVAAEEEKAAVKKPSTKKTTSKKSAGAASKSTKKSAKTAAKSVEPEEA